MNHSNPIQYIVWDWNGTLLNDAWVFVHLMNKELEQRKLPIINIKKYRENFVFPVKEYYKHLGFNFNKEPFEKIGLDFMKKYKEFKYKASLFDESLLVLKKIQTLGFPQSIISASHNVLLNDMINHYGIKHYFEKIIGLNHFFATSKIELAKNLCETIKYNNQNILFIGDTIHDFEIATTLGAQCVLFSKGHCSRQRLQNTNGKIINNLNQIINLIN